MSWGFQKIRDGLDQQAPCLLSGIHQEFEVADVARQQNVRLTGERGSVDGAVILRFGPGAGNFVFYLGATVEAKVGRVLAGGVFEAFEDVRREDGVFDADTGAVHAPSPPKAAS